MKTFKFLVLVPGSILEVGIKANKKINAIKHVKAWAKIYQPGYTKIKYIKGDLFPSSIPHA